jgi:hypothetical protein
VDTEGHRATKLRFYRKLTLLEGQGETPDCGQIAVKNLELFRRILESKAAEGMRGRLLGSSVNRARGGAAVLTTLVSVG